MLFVSFLVEGDLQSSPSPLSDREEVKHPLSDQESPLYDQISDQVSPLPRQWGIEAGICTLQPSVSTPQPWGIEARIYTLRPSLSTPQLWGIEVRIYTLWLSLSTPRPCDQITRRPEAPPVSFSPSTTCCILYLPLKMYCKEELSLQENGSTLLQQMSFSSWVHKSVGKTWGFGRIVEDNKRKKLYPPPPQMVWGGEYHVNFG